MYGDIALGKLENVAEEERCLDDDEEEDEEDDEEEEERLEWCEKGEGINWLPVPVWGPRRIAATFLGCIPPPYVLS
jgi:hypothetical protein